MKKHERSARKRPRPNRARPKTLPKTEPDAGPTDRGEGGRNVGKVGFFDLMRWLGPDDPQFRRSLDDVENTLNTVREGRAKLRERMTASLRDTYAGHPSGEILGVPTEAVLEDARLNAEEAANSTEDAQRARAGSGVGHCSTGFRESPARPSEDVWGQGVTASENRTRRRAEAPRQLRTRAHPSPLDDGGRGCPESVRSSRRSQRPRRALVS